MKDNRDARWFSNYPNITWLEYWTGKFRNMMTSNFTFNYAKMYNDDRILCKLQCNVTISVIMWYYAHVLFSLILFIHIQMSLNFALWLLILSYTTQLIRVILDQGVTIIVYKTQRVVSFNPTLSTFINNDFISFYNFLQLFYPIYSL